MGSGLSPTRKKAAAVDRERRARPRDGGAQEQRSGLRRWPGSGPGRASAAASLVACRDRMRPAACYRLLQRRGRVLVEPGVPAAAAGRPQNNARARGQYIQLAFTCKPVCDRALSKIISDITPSPVLWLLRCGVCVLPIPKTRAHNSAPRLSTGRVGGSCEVSRAGHRKRTPSATRSVWHVVLSTDDALK